MSNAWVEAPYLPDDHVFFHLIISSFYHIYRPLTRTLLYGLTCLFSYHVNVGITTTLLRVKETGCSNSNMRPMRPRSVL